MIIFESKQTTINQTGWDQLSIQSMASDMLDMDANGEPVTIDNLKLRQYSAADITRYGTRAASLARKLSVKAVQA